MGTRSTSRAARILLVDPHAETRAMLGFAFRADGHELIVRSLSLDIHECIRGVDGETRPPDVVVVVDRGDDATLEQMCTVCAQEARIPVVVITTFGSQGAPSWAASIGAITFDKRLDIERLRQVVRELGAARQDAAADPVADGSTAASDDETPSDK
jgi:DNA-binding NtrC family response regulator